MTQRQQAEQILDRLRLPAYDEQIQLKDALGAAQNPPPLGEADGSINEEALIALRDIADALHVIHHQLKVFKESLS